MTMTCSIMATSSFALGKNKVFRNEHGYKTYLVSSDKIDDYIKSLEIDKKKCWEEYNDWYGEGSKGAWKADVMALSPIIVTAVLAPIAYVSKRIIDKIRNKNAALPAAQPPVTVRRAIGRVATVGTATGALMLGTAIWAQKYNSVAKFLECDALADRAEYIPEKLKGRLWKEVQIYGAQIEVQGSLVCSVNSQKHLINPYK